MTRREQLAREGWTDRGTFDEPRLSEIADEYREIGFEVLLEGYAPEAAGGCGECMALAPERFKTVFTRKTCEGESRNG